MKKIILPLMIIFSHSAFANSSSEMISDIVNQYKMLGGHKALVVAIDEDKYAAGWGFKFSNTKRAIAKAMKGCNRSRLNYQVSAMCEVYMIDNKQQVSPNQIILDSVTTTQGNDGGDNTVITTTPNVTTVTTSVVDPSIANQINEVEETIEEVVIAN